MDELKPAVRMRREAQTRRSGDVLRQAARLRGIDGQLIRSKEEPAQRAANRIKLEHLRRQQNLETIIQLAYELCQDDVGQELDCDWLTHFLKLAEEIGSPQMQQLWARILARELVSAGKFSRKALNTLQTMTAKEAQLLQRACSLSAVLDQDHNRKLLVGFRIAAKSWGWLPRQAFKRLSLGAYRLPVSSLMLLGDLGLLYANELDSGLLRPDHQLELDYQGHKWLLRPRKPIALSYYRFTPVGNELAQLLSQDPVEQYQEALSQLLQQGFQFE